MMRLALVAVAVATIMAAGASCQDPPPGWTAYSTATCPAGTHLTHFEAKWKNLDNPTIPGGFWSPWIGTDTSDNMDLLQPVNPWLGNSWSIYSEHFDWNGMSNQNSPQKPSNAGDTIHGVISSVGSSGAMKSTQNDVTTGASSSLYAQTPAGKQWTVLYIVLEKVMEQCGQYAPNGVVTFYDIQVFCSGRQVFPEWTTAHVDRVCNMQAKVLNKTAIEITWDVNAPNPTSDKLKLNDMGKRRLVPLSAKKP